jgi:hypothetical protein
MSYLRYLNQFNALENESFFSDSARGLFQRLLYHFNKPTNRKWEAPLQVNLTLLQMLTGSSPNTLKKSLKELQARGVIHYQEPEAGRGKTGPLRLLKVHRITGSPGELNPSDFDGFTDGFGDEFNYVAPVKPSTKPSTKPSNFDDTIREVREVRDVTTTGPAAKKKEGEIDFSQSPADASHTGGGAAAGPVSEGLRALADTDVLPPHFALSLPDSDPRKFIMIPQDAAMVDEYLRGHPDPKISKHAGSGHLFFDYYESVGFRVGKRQMENWRATARSYSFIDYKTIRENEQAAKRASRGGQLDKRAEGLSEAQQILADMRKEQAGG